MSRHPLFIPFLLLVLVCGAFYGMNLWKAYEVISVMDTHAVLPRALLYSCAFALGTTLFAALLGLPLGWLFEREVFRYKSLLNILAIAPLFIPLGLVPFGLEGWAWVDDSSSGSFAEHLGTRMPALVVLVAVHLFPLIYLVSRYAIRQVDPAQERVARTLGCTGWQSFKRVTFPQIKKPVIFACVVVFALAASHYLI